MSVIGRPKTVDREQLAELLYDVTLSPKEISELLDCSIRSVYAVASELGFDMDIRRRTLTIYKHQLKLQQQIEENLKKMRNNNSQELHTL